ncbi:MAG: DUF885 domain-containing protein [Candidatus Baltobacteraceae bacterium]
MNPLFFVGGTIIVRYLIASFFLALLAAAVPADASAQGSVHDRLTRLAQDVVYTSAARDPMTATNLGIPGHDAELAIPTEASRRADLKRLRAWEKQLHAIAPANAHLSLVDRDDAKLLQAQLTGSIRNYTVYNSDRKDYSGPAQAIIAIVFTQFQHLPIVGQNGATQADLSSAWDAIVSRLRRAPAYIVAAQKMVTTPGHLQGVVGNEQLAGAADFFNGALSNTAKNQLTAAQFARFATARDATLQTVAETAVYIKAHVASWPENYAIGRRAYNNMLRDEQLLPYTANDVERMGADELAHGWAEEAWLRSLSQQRKTPFGPSTGGGIAPGGPALISYYHDRIAELREYMSKHDIVTVPDWLGEIKVVETPSFLQPVSPGASMNSPRLFSPETTGYYFITPPKSLEEAARTLDMNQDFDRDRIWSTAAHEAMPGHFLQLSIAKRHPDFIRKIQSSGVFAEGWAFYGEEMFVRLGLYGDDLDGRLYTARWERVRGARATVDPKLASGEWTYRQAADFFAQQTGFTKGASDAAVAGIALGPGYVISYTVGRLQLENLEAQYLLRVGAKGSLHDFHDRLLSYGTTPFAIIAPELIADLNKPASQVRAAANY